MTNLSERGARVRMTGSVFINYRRDDEPNFAMLLYTRLERKFSSDHLFMDIDSIMPGDDFVRILRENVEKCDVVLSVIGKNWLDARDDAGNRRLDNPDDFVRIELEQAFELGKRIIPILVGNANMPRREDLPDSLRPLATRHAVRFLPDRFRFDAENLERALDRVLAAPSPPAAAQPPAPETLAPEDAAAIPKPASLEALRKEPPLPVTPHSARPAIPATSGDAGETRQDNRRGELSASSRQEAPVPLRWTIPGGSLQGQPRLVWKSWQRVALLAGISLAIYLVLSATSLLQRHALFQIEISPTHTYYYDPTRYLGATVAIIAGYYLFSSATPLRAFYLLSVLLLSTIPTTMLYHFVIYPEFDQSNSSSVAISLFLLWFTICLLFLVIFRFFCRGVNRPDVVLGIAFAGAAIQAIASANSIEMDIYRATGLFGLGVAPGMTVVAAGCGWFFAGPAAGPSVPTATTV